MPLTIATRDDERQYFEGGNYELNLSFDSLRVKQWQRVIKTLWEHPALFGPLGERYIPGKMPGDKLEIQVPPPTATMTQHGQLQLGTNQVIGCEVLATRSLFECVSILIPLGMFDGLVGSMGIRHEHPELQALDDILNDIALCVFDVVPFKIAAIGYERGCQLLAELRTSAEMRHTFLITGNFMAHEEVLRAIEPDLASYEELRPHLRWLSPRL